MHALLQVLMMPRRGSNPNRIQLSFQLFCVPRKNPSIWVWNPGSCVARRNQLSAAAQRRWLRAAWFCSAERARHSNIITNKIEVLRSETQAGARVLVIALASGRMWRRPCAGKFLRAQGHSSWVCFCYAFSCHRTAQLCSGPSPL